MDLEQVHNDSPLLQAELPNDEIDLHRVRVGIHEAGHSLVADALGGKVKYARLEMSWLGLGSDVNGGLMEWRPKPVEEEDEQQEGADNTADVLIKVALAGNEGGAWAWHHYLGYELPQARAHEMPGSGYDLDNARKLRKYASKPMKQLQREVEQLVKVNRQTLFKLGVQVALKKQLDGKKFAGQAKAA